jgi:hypothetical protein
MVALGFLASDEVVSFSTTINHPPLNGRVLHSVPLFEIAELPSLTGLKDKLDIQNRPSADQFQEDFGLDRMRLQWIPASRLEVMGDEFWRLRRKEDSQWSRVSKL